MRFIAFGDIHMTTARCRTIPGIEKADLLIATGDLTNYGKRADAKKVLDDLLAINGNLLAVAGNLDHWEINDYLEELQLNLHGQARLIQGQVCLFGLGGSNPTPFATPAEFEEREIATALGRAYEQAQEFIALAKPLKKSHIPTILISHAPPLGTSLDRLKTGKHVGSLAVREFLERHQPDLCLTGHIHEARGEDRIGQTHILNPGMLQHGGWVEITFSHSRLSATLK